MREMSYYFDTAQTQLNDLATQYDPEGLYAKIATGVIVAIIGWLAIKMTAFVTSRTWAITKAVVRGVTVVPYNYFYPAPVPTPVDPQMAALEHCLDDPEALWDDSKKELLSDNLLVKTVLYADGTYGIKSAHIGGEKGEDVCVDLSEDEKKWLSARVTDVVRGILLREKTTRRLTRAHKLMAQPIHPYTAQQMVPEQSQKDEAQGKSNRKYEPTITEALRRLRT